MEPTIKYENCEDLFNTDIPPINKYNLMPENFHFQLNTNRNESHTHKRNYQEYNNMKKSNITEPKRIRRGDAAVLFSPPFFELQQKYDKANEQGTIIARCRSCLVVLRGHKNVSSNFIKHMKRVHPEVYQIYENLKLMKNCEKSSSMAKQFVPPHLPEEENVYFNASHFLQDISVTPRQEKEQNVEINDDSGTMPLNFTETCEISTESQHTICGTMTEKIEFGKVDLSSKTLQAMSSMLDDKLRDFVTKDELNSITQQNQITRTVKSQNDLIAANENAVTISAPSTDKDTLQSQLDALRQSNWQLQRELQALDKELHQRNLIVRNIPIADNEKPQEAIEKLFNDRLQLPNISLQNVDILIKKNRNAQNNNKHIVKIVLSNQSDVGTIFKNCHKLKNSGIFIELELSQFARKRKEKLLVLRRELLRRDAALKISVRGEVLIVDEHQFHWSETVGLCIRDKTYKAYAARVNMANETNAADCLYSLTGQDLKEFLNVLMNYDVQIK